MSEYLNKIQKQQLLDMAIISGDFVLASGKRKKQKFDFDLIFTKSNIFDVVVLCLAKCIRDNFSDYNGILTIANGATRLGNPLSKILRVPHIKSSYYINNLDVKCFSIEPLVGIDKVIIIDDVFTLGTNAKKVILLAKEHNIETLGVTVVLDRSGNTRTSILNKIIVASLVQKELK